MEANPPGFFAAELAKVQPSNEHLTSPRLEATAYGERVINDATFAVGREKLVSLLLKEANGKESLKPVEKAETHRIVDKAIRKDVEAFLASRPALTIEEWKTWCANYRIGDRGPKVIKVLMTKTKANATGEYHDMSKDGTRQLRRGEMHRGYFVYWVPSPTKKEPDKKRAMVRPVYAFQSEVTIQRELRGQGIMGGQFFESGCTVELTDRVEHPKTPLVAGKYLLNSIWEQGNVVVTDNTGKVSAPIALSHMLRAGLQRCDHEPL